TGGAYNRAAGIESGAEHVGARTVEGSLTTALNVVPANTEAQDVLTNGLAAVILQLVVGLWRSLRRQKVRTYRERPDVDADWIVGEGEIGPASSIHDLVLKFQVREADGM